jgi:hypothetical protein
VRDTPRRSTEELSHAVAQLKMMGFKVGSYARGGLDVKVGNLPEALFWARSYMGFEEMLSGSEACVGVVIYKGAPLILRFRLDRPDNEAHGPVTLEPHSSNRPTAS